MQHGRVVHAVGGQRDHYQPLQTPLSACATFTSVADGLLQNYPSPILYVADLDAIAGDGNHTNEVLAYLQSRPDLNVWLDSGIKEVSQTTLGKNPDNLHVVVGTESFLSTSDQDTKFAALDNRIVLSLDFRGADFLGPTNLLEQNGLWPSRVIVMTLEAVGTKEGPDFHRIAEIVEMAGDRDVYAAGGVRSLADLRRLGEMGVAGALVASALHSGQIKTGDLEEIAGF